MWNRNGILLSVRVFGNDDAAAEFWPECSIEVALSKPTLCCRVRILLPSFLAIMDMQGFQFPVFVPKWDWAFVAIGRDAPAAEIHTRGQRIYIEFHGIVHQFGWMNN